MENLHFVNGKCDEMLANDIVRQLQTKIKMSLERNKQGIHGSVEGWEKGLSIGEQEKAKKHKWASKCWYRTLTVTIGNDDFIVMALRSYDTIVGFIYNDYMYEIGDYTKTTHMQFIKYFEPALKQYFKEKIIYNRITPVDWHRL